MTVQRDPDLGLLAEFAEGLLDGTPEASTVAHLIASDERWERAYTELQGALGAVRHDLATLGAGPGIPPEVAARLEAALDDLRPSSVAPLRGRSRRRLRLAVLAAGVAATVAVGVGFSLSRPVVHTNQDRASSLSSAPESIGDTRITRSGKDYGAEPYARAQQSGGETGTAPALTRLADPAALRRCLEALRQLTGSAPLSADFGTVHHTPALVVTLPGGTRIAVGAACDLGRPDVLTHLVDTP